MWKLQGYKRHSSNEAIVSFGHSSASGDLQEAQIREQQAGFRRGRGRIDNIFTLQQVLELRQVYHRPTIAVFIDFKGAFDSVDRSSHMHTLIIKGIPKN